MNNSSREAASDRASRPIGWYVYVLELSDGGYYVGQSNNLPVRHLEHLLDVGSERTRGKSGNLVWFNQVGSRDGARSMERRVQRAIDSSPQKFESMRQTFRQLVDLVKPDKSLRELQEDELEYEAEMASSFHLTKMRMSQHYAICDWDGFYRGRPALYGTGDVDSFRKELRLYRAHIEAGGDRTAFSYGKLPPCQNCHTTLATEDVAS